MSIEPVAIIPYYHQIVDSKTMLWNNLQKETEKLKPLVLSLQEVHHRFLNISCPRETAVKVGEKYVHANVLFPHEKTPLVASQCPFYVDGALFWGEIYEKGYTLIDLTGPKDSIENVRYYPEKDQSMVFGDLIIKEEGEEGYLRKYLITHSQTGESKAINRYNWIYWEDFKTVSVDDLDNMIGLMEKEEKPLWIHCLAGIGRTGALGTAFLLKKKIEEEKITLQNFESSLLELILLLRSRRGEGFIQTVKQFELVYNYGLELVKKKLN